MSLSRLIRWWLLLMGAMVVFVVIRGVILDSTRAMFHNHWGRNDRMFLSRWVFTPPMIDRAGNLAQYDEKLNLFVIVFTHESDGYNRYGLWGGTYDDATLTNDQRETIATIARTENRLIIFDLKARARFESNLNPGDAMKWRAKIDPRDGATGVVDDIAVVLKDELAHHRYPQGAVPMATWD